MDINESLMHFEEGLLHIEGLLHLAGIVVVTTTAYIGIDRVRHEADDFQKLLQQVRERVRAMLLRLDVKHNGKLTLKNIFDRSSVHILCHVAKEPIELGAGRRIIHALHRQKYVPILGYFRKRTDRIIVGVLAVISLFIFLVLTATAMLSAKHEYLVHFTWFSFVFLSTAMIWIFATVACSYRLRHLDSTCRKFEGEAQAYVDEVFSDAMAAVAKREQIQRAT